MRHPPVRHFPGVLLGLCLLTAGCAHLATPPPPPSATLSAAEAREQPCIATPHGCIALNPDVTADTIGRTICVPGYTRSVRPSSSYAQGIKLRLMREAGLDLATISAYELDHIVPLALGGHPRKLSNLALQPWEGEHGAHRKDALETRLHAQVCRHELSLQAAQTCIAANWEACAARESGSSSP
jgi:hypothetical protein